MTQYERRRHFIECECHSPEHLAQLVYFADDCDPDCRSVYLAIHLVTWERFPRRLWTAIKYAFGYRSRYGHWDEIIIDPAEARRIIEFLEGFETSK